MPVRAQTPIDRYEALKNQHIQMDPLFFFVLFCYNFIYGQEK